MTVPEHPDPGEQGADATAGGPQATELLLGPDYSAQPGARDLVLSSIGKQSRAHIVTEFERVDELRERITHLETNLETATEALYRQSERLYMGPYLALVRIALTVGIAIAVPLARTAESVEYWALVVAIGLAYIAAEAVGVVGANRAAGGERRPRPNTGHKGGEE